MISAAVHRQQSLRRPIAISAIVHLAIFTAFAVTPSLRLPQSERPISVTWVELPRGTSEEIGLGLKKAESLPTSTIEEQKKLYQPEAPPVQTPLSPTKPPPAPPEEPKEAQPRPKMQIEKEGADAKKVPAKRPASTTDRRMKDALAKIDKQLRDRTVVPEAAQVDQSGEGYKYGTGNKPLRVPPSDPEYLKYQAMVRYRIMREWIVPMSFAEGGPSLNAKIEVLINTDGDVVSARWISRSGNASFDQAALRAVKKASPFPKPPDRLAWEAYNEGFLIEFDPRLKAKY